MFLILLQGILSLAVQFLKLTKVQANQVRTTAIIICTHTLVLKSYWVPFCWFSSCFWFRCTAVGRPDDLIQKLRVSYAMEITIRMIREIDFKSFAEDRTCIGSIRKLRTVSVSDDTREASLSLSTNMPIFINVDLLPFISLLIRIYLSG